MSFDRPALTEIIERLQAGIASRLPGSDPLLPNSILNILAQAFAGVAHGEHGHLAWAARQIIPDTAEAEHLERLALWLGRGMTRKGAAAATGDVVFTGSDGSVVPAGTVLQRSDQLEYATDADATISAGSATVAATATTVGSDTNTTASTNLSLVAPIAGVNSQAAVDAGGLNGGSDIETDAQLLSRLREFVANETNGVNANQYETWALEVEGVTRAWCRDAYLGAGTVGLFFVRDGDVSIIPDATEVQAVQDYLDALRPVGMLGLTVLAPTELVVDMTITLNPNTVAVQDAVTAELQDLFARVTEVEDGSGNAVILLSQINEAISIAAGEEDHILVVPAANVAPSLGEIPTLGSITWQAP